MKPFTLPVRVYVEDTDAGGIVYYVNYLKYMERARTELLRSLGYDKPAVFTEGLMFVVKSMEVSYDNSAELDDSLLVSAKIVKLGRASMLMEQKVTRVKQLAGQKIETGKNTDHQELLCSGLVKIACISQQHRTPAAMPGDMFRHLQSHIND